MSEKRRYILVFAAERWLDEWGYEVPPIIRLRRVLKYALRFCGLRCVGHTEPVDGFQDGEGI